MYGSYAQSALVDNIQITMIPGERCATSVRWPGAEVDSLRLNIYIPYAGLDPSEKRPIIVIS